MTGRPLGLPKTGSRLDRVARDIYARRPFVMASTPTTNCVSLGRSFDWDSAPWYYQADILDLAAAAIAAMRPAQSARTAALTA